MNRGKYFTAWTGLRLSQRIRNEDFLRIIRVTNLESVMEVKKDKWHI
jgi:hypothetical protein